MDKLFGPENAPIHTINASTDCSAKLRGRFRERDRVDSFLFPLSTVADVRVFKRERSLSMAVAAVCVMSLDDGSATKLMAQCIYRRPFIAADLRHSLLVSLSLMRLTSRSVVGY